jgi:hypothetical protein
MKYVHAPNGTFQDFVLSGQVYEFSDRCKTTPKRLTPEEATEYGVSLLRLVTPPAYDPITQGRREIAPTLTDGAWMQQWEVYVLDAEDAAANQAAAVAALQQSIVDGTQKRLDDFARTRFYDGILSLCTYATDTNPKFQAEGQYGVTARSDTWATLYGILDEVLQGTRPMPSGYDDIAGELPVLAWPE